jgi:hypothetical protein
MGASGLAPSGVVAAQTHGGSTVDMEFRVFPQPKPEPDQQERSPVFGKRQPPQHGSSRPSTRRLAETAALGLGAAYLAYLVIGAF